MQNAISFLHFGNTFMYVHSSGIRVTRWVWDRIAQNVALPIFLQKLPENKVARKFGLLLWFEKKPAKRKQKAQKVKICPILSNWDRCYDFKNIFAEKNCEKMAFLTHNKAKLCKIFDHNVGFWENAIFLAEKLSKVAENCDHNIDPCNRKFLSVFTEFVQSIRSQW
jgi:hypothetical protein